VAGCGGGSDGTATVTPPATPPPPSSAFFFQDVTPSGNSVRVGFTTDGRVIESTGVNVLSWQVSGNPRPYGDPVFSRLSNGRWAMTATTAPLDPRGGLALQYHEASCPQVVESAVRVLPNAPSTACEAAPATAMAKTSQVFDAGGSNYLFTMVGAKIYLVRLSDATRGASDLTSICIRKARATTLAELQWGEASMVVDATQAPGVLLSDSAVARRSNGTWVLFLKGFPSGLACPGGSLCELCARAIYRTTSNDLVTWSALEKLVEPASIPDASNAADGTVWLYWQDFGPACAAQNLALAQRAPIMGVPELANGALGTIVTVTLAGEAAQTNPQLHYPTNANPVRLPDAGARASLEACLRQ
jgi:hypothetical protein